MDIRQLKDLSSDDVALRLKELNAENKRLRALVAKLEVRVISLKNENAALKKRIEERAQEKFSEMVSDIMQRAGDSCGPGPSGSRSD